jgi:hypothetical protein
MTIINDPNLWVICGLVFLLGLLMGIFLGAGGRRKWRSRYKEEAARREAIETEHERHRKDWEARDREWRERDSARAAAVPDRRDPAVRDRRDPADEPRI